MSEKLTKKRTVVESVEKSKEIACKSKEHCSKKEEQTLNKKPMEDTKKTTRKGAEEHKTGTQNTIKMQNIKATPKTSTSNKPQDPEAMGTCKMSEKSTSTKLEASEVPEIPKIHQKPQISSEITASIKGETPKVPEACQMPTTTSETSTSTKPKTPEVQEIPSSSSVISCPGFTQMLGIEIPKVCKMPKTTPEKSSSTKFEAPEVPEVPKICQMPKATSEISTSTECETPKIPEACQISKTMSETSTPIKLETPVVSEVQKICQMQKTTSEMSTSIEYETLDVPEACQIPKTTSETSTSTKPKTPEAQEILGIRTIPLDTLLSQRLGNYELLQKSKIMPEMFDTTSTKLEIPEDLEGFEMPELIPYISATDKTEEPKVPEVRRTCSMSKMPTSAKTEKSEVPEVRRTRSTASQISIPLKLNIPEVPETYSVMSKMSSTTSEEEFNSAKDIDDNLKMITEKLEETSFEEMEVCDSTGRPKWMGPRTSKKDIRHLMRFRIGMPVSNPNLNDRPLVLATQHIVPSLPIGLFQVFAEMIEAATKKPVVLLHECRETRMIPSEMVDIAVLPPDECWKSGLLLPATFIFEHDLNKTKSVGVYADVIVASNSADQIKSIVDLREHPFVIPEKRSNCTAAGLLFNLLQSKGENLLFSDKLITVRSEFDVLEMVVNKEVPVGVLESPVMRAHYNLPGVESLTVLTSMGPLPPYRIMVKDTLPHKMVQELTSYLLEVVNKYDTWLDKLVAYDILGFAKNSIDIYHEFEEKHALHIPIY